jgi:YmgG-like glycine-zipper protein
MKPLLSLGLALLALAPLRGQILGPGATQGAFLGGIAGAVIGHESGSLSHRGWQGAAIGAGVGLLIGAAADANRPRPASYAGGASEYGGYYYGGAAYDGLILGSLVGGIAGRHVVGGGGYRGWRGAAWGAGAGWLLGSIFEANKFYAAGYDGPAYSYPRFSAVTTAPVYALAPVATATVQPVTGINHDQSSGVESPMAPANSLFGR